MSAAYDPFADDVLVDPYPWYGWLRDESPCHYVEERDIWIISRYKDVVAVLRDHENFSSEQGIGYERRNSHDMLSADPPQHTRLRRLVNKSFLPRTIQALEPRIEEIVDKLLQEILEKGEVDLISDFAAPLPIMVIAEQLGVPPDRHPDFRRWTDDLADLVSGRLGAGEVAAKRASRSEFAAFLREVVTDRRGRQIADANADLITTLVNAQESDALTESEVLSFLVLLITAGNETTTSAIGNGVLAVMDHPDQWRSVIANPSLVQSFVEEVLRFDSPVQGFFRNTIAPVQVAGVTVPADAKVLVLFGAANRDPSHYPSADTFKAARNPSDHVAFGSGIHHCLGAPLARLELRLVVTGFLGAVRRLVVAGDVVRTRTPLFRGVRELPVYVQAR